MIAPPKPPSPDQLEALIKEARARQMRRRLFGAGSVAVLAAAALGVYALFGAGAPGNLSPPSASGDVVPLCRSSQLSTVASFQGATQTMLGGAELTNRSSTTCSLPLGRPAVSILWHGRPLRIRQRAEGSGRLSWRRAHDMAPGAKAFIGLQWFNTFMCGPTERTWTHYAPRFVLRFRGGLVVSALGTGMTSPTCRNPAVSFLGVSPPLIPS